MTCRAYSKNLLIGNPFVKISLFCFLYNFQEQPEMFLNLINKKLFDDRYFYFSLLAINM